MHQLSMRQAPVKDCDDRHYWQMSKQNNLSRYNYARLLFIVAILSPLFMLLCLAAIFIQFKVNLSREEVSCDQAELTR